MHSLQAELLAGPAAANYSELELPRFERSVASGSRSTAAKWNENYDDCNMPNSTAAKWNKIMTTAALPLY